MKLKRIKRKIVIFDQSRTKRNQVSKQLFFASFKCEFCLLLLFFPASFHFYPLPVCVCVCACVCVTVCFCVSEKITLLSLSLSCFSVCQSECPSFHLISDNYILNLNPIHKISSSLSLSLSLFCTRFLSLSLSQHTRLA